MPTAHPEPPLVPSVVSFAPLQPSTSTAPLTLPSVPLVQRTAPELPAEVLAAIKNPVAHQKLRNVIRITKPEDVARMAEIEKQCNAIHDRENLFTCKHRRSIMITWSIIVASKYPNLPISDHWSTPIVLALTKFYLRWWVSLLYTSSLGNAHFNL